MEEKDKTIANLKALIIFLASTYTAIDDFVYKHCDVDALVHYPVVQGTRNQMDIRTIGTMEKDVNKKAIRNGVEYMLRQEK